MSDIMKKMLVLDFDGTLFQPGKFISDQDLKLLKALANMSVVRVIATGRSLFSLKKVIDMSFPIDYLILSTGVGILDWRSQKLIRSYDMEGGLVDEIIAILKRRRHSFFVHQPAPQNHKFFYYDGIAPRQDFTRRFELYRDFARPLKQRKRGMAAGQILVISEELQQIKEELQPLMHRINIIRTTSPLDGRSMWVEIFDKRVNKALAAQFLAERLNISVRNIVALGNDYNDLDLLNWAGSAFVVHTAPEELKEKFQIIKNADDGLLIHIMPLLRGN
ncbi:HAD hydrolase family protein [Caldithrix abyssi]